ncbi:MAG: hypothetical protein QNK04_14620 [Myxococcota bacterium]|nr:hypothetical protein [Myxococcota bacterium]
MSQLDVSCQGQDDQASIPSGASLSCDVANAGGQGVAEARTSFGLRPQADVQASASGVSAGALAAATVIYQAQIRETAAPPVGGLFTLPLRIRTRGEVSDYVEGYSEGIAQVTVFAEGELVFELTAQPPSLPNFDFENTEETEIETVFDVSINASCSASSDAGLLASGCQAVVDPEFAFDQAAFDAAMGPDTFPLEDFYAIELSANLTTPVPALRGAWRLVAPATLLVVAILAMARLGPPISARRR